MKILIISQRFPAKNLKGDQLLLYNQIKWLLRFNKNIEIFLVTINDSSNLQLYNSLDSRELHFKKVFFITKPHRINYIYSFIKTIFNFKPLQVNLFWNIKNYFLIKRIVQEIKPNLIHYNTLRLSSYYFKNIPSSLDFIDSLSLNVFSTIKFRNLFLKPIFFLEYYLLKYYEYKMVKKMNVCFVVSNRDKLFINKSSIIVNHIGNNFSDKKITLNNALLREKRIIFHGNMSYLPNKLAAVNLIRYIYPIIIEKNPDYSLYIVGNNPGSDLLRYQSPNIKITGRVDDIIPFLSESYLSIVPLVNGSGMQNKIIESMLVGTPVLTTFFGANGMPKNIKDNLFISDSYKAIAEYAIVLINDKNKWKNLSINTYKSSNNEFSWKKHVKILIKNWNKVLDNKNEQ
jgi:glycosyltransferase involved in cell wall biosynthesis